jgi:hypothetical protein
MGKHIRSWAGYLGLLKEEVTEGWRKLHKEELRNLSGGSSKEMLFN